MMKVTAPMFYAQAGLIRAIGTDLDIPAGTETLDNGGQT